VGEFNTNLNFIFIFIFIFTSRISVYSYSADDTKFIKRYSSFRECEHKKVFYKFLVYFTSLFIKLL
jgi:hypothetical protein